DRDAGPHFRPLEVPVAGPPPGSRGSPGPGRTPAAPAEAALVVPMRYKGQTASRRSVENREVRDLHYAALFFWTAVAAFRITSSTKSGWDNIGTWLLSVSKIVAPIRFATKRSNSGWMVRSFVATMYQLGFDLQAVPSTFCLN